MRFGPFAGTSRLIFRERLRLHIVQPAVNSLFRYQRLVRAAFDKLPFFHAPIRAHVSPSIKQSKPRINEF